MGKSNVEGRLSKCGATPVLYTYPAWTFPGKHRGDDSTPGPGPGNFVPGSTFSGVGPGFGPPPHLSQAEKHGPYNPGPLPQLAKGPKYSFGQPHKHKGNATPGPQDYTIGAWPHNYRAGNSWGPPPSGRPASAPRPIRVEEPILRKTRGPSFGLSHRPPRTADVPGPNAYHTCHGCCMACQGYKGHSFGLRPPTFYGGKAVSPGPANYHTECSSIGAATQNCESGSSTFRTKRGLSH